jgi:hypothetical protein
MDEGANGLALLGREVGGDPKVNLAQPQHPMGKEDAQSARGRDHHFMQGVVEELALELSDGSASGRDPGPHLEALDLDEGLIGDQELKVTSAGGQGQRIAASVQPSAKQENLHARTLAEQVGSFEVVGDEEEAQRSLKQPAGDQRSQGLTRDRHGVAWVKVSVDLLGKREILGGGLGDLGLLDDGSSVNPSEKARSLQKGEVPAGCRGAYPEAAGDLGDRDAPPLLEVLKDPALSLCSQHSLSLHDFD